MKLLKASATWAAAIVLVACDSPCLSLPCPEPFAVGLSVTSASSGAPLATATVAVGGPAGSYSLPCNTMCGVPGGAGTYELDISAPGFLSTHREVKVSGTDPKCGCPHADTQQLTVALTPAP